MLLLTGTSDKIRILTASSVSTIYVHASYMDYNGSTITPSRANTQITTATTTDVVSSPGSGVQRDVRTLSIRNGHASSSNAITIIHTDGSTACDLFKYTLLAGESIEYMDDEFYLVDASGNRK